MPIPPAWPKRGFGGGDAPCLHAHQIVLEILAETGVIGLLLWLAAVAQAWRGLALCTDGRA